MSCSDVIGTELVEVPLATLEVTKVTLKNIFFPKKIENSLVEILLPKTKPLIVGTINRPSNKVNFFNIINEKFDRLDTYIE